MCSDSRRRIGGRPGRADQPSPGPRPPPRHSTAYRARSARPADRRRLRGRNRDDFESRRFGRRCRSAGANRTANDQCQGRIVRSRILCMAPALDRREVRSVRSTHPPSDPARPRPERRRLYRPVSLAAVGHRPGPREDRRPRRDDHAHRSDRRAAHRPDRRRRGISADQHVCCSGTLGGQISSMAAPSRSHATRRGKCLSG